MKKDIIRSTPEWNALNKIWKSCTKEQQQFLEPEFRLLTDFVRANTVPRFTTPAPDQYGYLQGLSAGAQALIIDKIQEGEPNLYHSIMSVIDGKLTQGKDSLQEYYYEKFGSKRAYIKENWSLVCEIFDFCWKKNIQKNSKKGQR